MPLIRLKRLPKISNPPMTPKSEFPGLQHEILVQIVNYAIEVTTEDERQSTPASYAVCSTIYAAAKEAFFPTDGTRNRLLEASIYVDMIPIYKSPANKREMKVMYSSADTFTKRRIFWDEMKHLKLNITIFHVSWMPQMVGKAELADESEVGEPEVEELNFEEPKFEGTPLHNFNQYCVANRRYAGVTEEVELLAREIANITFNAPKLETLDLRLQHLHPYMARHIVRELRKLIEAVPRPGMVELEIDHTLAAD